MTVSRAQAMGETAGFIKFVVDADTDKLLGMHVLADMAADLLPQGVLAMHAEFIDLLRASVYTHPTLSEGIKAALGNLKPFG